MSSHTNAYGKMRDIRRLLPAALCLFGLAVAAVSGQQAPDPPPFTDTVRAAEALPRNPAGIKQRADLLRDAIAQPFVGVTTHGRPEPGLFSLRSSGVDTAPIRRAAEAVLKSFRAEQRQRASFDIDDPQWRRWDKVPSPPAPPKLGVNMAEMTVAQRDLVFALLQVSLSAKGFKTSQDIMKLNGTMSQGMKSDRFGQWLYSIAIMGSPSDKGPWGWQLNGHHLAINYFVLGDQLVMTPTFMGAEPARATFGEFVGTAALQDEQNKGEQLFLSLNPALRARATLSTRKGQTNNLAEAYSDNLVLDYAGAQVKDMSAAQRAALVDLIGEYVGNLPAGQAKIRMEEVVAHLDATYFAWIGSATVGGVFYYRIQSPVILIEFDHQGSQRAPAGTAIRDHIHTVVRTPNGNDYGKDLLRQHYLTQPH